MNALHADVLTAQCRRYVQLLAKFSEEVAKDEKCNKEEQLFIRDGLHRSIHELNIVANEIHDRYRHLGDTGYLPK